VTVAKGTLDVARFADSPGTPRQAAVALTFVNKQLKSHPPARLHVQSEPPRPGTVPPSHPPDRRAPPP